MSTQPLPKKKPKGLFLLLFLVATPIFVIYMMSLGTDPATNNTSSVPTSNVATPVDRPVSQSVDNPSAAVKLATLDSGQYVDPTNPIIEKYQAQFNSLRSISSGVNDSELANTAYLVSQDELKKV